MILKVFTRNQTTISSVSRWWTQVEDLVIKVARGKRRSIAHRKLSRDKKSLFDKLSPSGLTIPSAVLDLEWGSHFICGNSLLFSWLATICMLLFFFWSGALSWWELALCFRSISRDIPLSWTCCLLPTKTTSGSLVYGMDSTYTRFLNSSSCSWKWRFWCPHGWRIQ